MVAYFLVFLNFGLWAQSSEIMWNLNWEYVFLQRKFAFSSVNMSQVFPIKTHFNLISRLGISWITKGIYIFVYRGLSPKPVVISGLELLLLREELLSPEAKQSQVSFFVFHFAEECGFFGLLLIVAITLWRSLFHDGIDFHLAQHRACLPDSHRAIEATFWPMESNTCSEDRHSLGAGFPLCFCAFFQLWLLETSRSFMQAYLCI